MSKILAAFDSVAVQILGIASVVMTALYPTYGKEHWFIAIPGVISGLSAYFSARVIATSSSNTNLTDTKT